MSFCPTKDIHSVYLDNELPDAYKGDYEKHIQQCEKCRNELARLKAVRAVFQADVRSISPDRQFLDESYKRLMIKMSYNKNSKKIKKPLFFKVGYAVSAAAAAILVAVFIPMGLGTKSSPAETNSPPAINRMIPLSQFGNNISFGSGNNIAISGNMDESILSSNNSYSNYRSYKRNGYNNFINVNLFEYMEGVDALRPQFTEDDIISIRVTIPSIGEIPIDLDNDLQGLVLSGNYLWNRLEN